ncbi:exonuclease subunit SbcD [Colwellia sp. 1_MG-2023]|uniref:exonuclease subunit SbcD n=1 Tax=Colwellia sp. 1_MG-2023 TaxID=3062649 RepID=UPI0026E49555|nr:exonuclease subunit SbcD [Colwellia sp. 1_MG-2023]MDO6446873.1 exonuclease subunit SbcD [Colwellia sp. 1_MG-2023]
MAFRILHTSDWHLGQYFYGKSRAQEHQQFLTWLLAQVSQHKIQAVIVAGDIFDTGTPPSYAREMYFDFIVKIHQLNCQLIILAGNHDSVAMLGESKAVLSALSCRVITTASEKVEQQLIEINDKNNNLQAVICAIPFIRPRDILLSQAGQSSQEKQQALQQAITEHYQQLYQRAESISKGEVPIIATGHLTAVGVTSSDSVRDIYIGTLEAFPANAFPEADYIALGHIHRSQKVGKTEHIRYCGSPIPLSFDEVSQDKQVLLAEFTQKTLTEVKPLVIPRFQAMAMIKTTLDDLEQAVKALLEAIDNGESKQTTAASGETDNIHLAKGENVWLDIEIESADYLTDLSHKIEQITQAYPVEVLLTRRTKKARKAMIASEAKVTLDELKITDVFQTRLAEESWQSEAELARKQRLNELFLTTVSQVESARQQEVSIDESQTDSLKKAAKNATADGELS